MNKKQIFSILTVLMITTAFFGCSTEDEDPAIPPYFNYTAVGAKNTNEPVVGATVYYYSSELDFLLGENEFASGVTNEWGEYEIRTDSAVNWVRAELGELNNLREYTLDRIIYTSENGYKSYQVGDNIYVVLCQLSRTPTRMQINVIDNNLNPVEGATVQLFFSQEDFDTDLPAQKNEEELKTSYSFGHSLLKEWFSGSTDEEGMVLFDNLEPKQYWFKVTKDGLTNATTTIKTDKSLPDDWNITNVITVRVE